MMRNVTTTIRDVQAKLLDLFNDRTILIGHSLESDMIAVKVTVRDLTFFSGNSEIHVWSILHRNVI